MHAEPWDWGVPVQITGQQHYVTPLLLYNVVKVWEEPFHSDVIRETI